MLLSAKAPHVDKTKSTVENKAQKPKSFSQRSFSKLPQNANAFLGHDKPDPQMMFSLQHAIGNRGLQKLLSSRSQRDRHAQRVAGSVQNANSSSGRYLDPEVRRDMESKFGSDFSAVKVHADSQASRTADSYHADALTAGRQIYFAGGKYNPSSREGRHLLAHELTHVVQQSSRAAPTQAPQLKSASTAPSTEPSEIEAEQMADQVVAGDTGKDAAAVPNVVDLQGISNLQEIEDFKTVDDFITQNNGKALINAKFGDIAAGQLQMRKKGEDYVGRGTLPLLRHPLVPPSISGAGLSLTINKNLIGGRIVLGPEEEFSKLVRKKDVEVLRSLGLQGFDLKGLNVKNSIEDGILGVGVEKYAFSIGNIVSGSGTILTMNDKVMFEASADVNVPGLQQGRLDFKRDENGVMSGTAQIGVTLKQGKFSGNVVVTYNGDSISGEGKIGYKSEKFSGQVVLRLVDENAAEGKPGAPAKEAKRKPKYVVTGDGTLDFAFNEWLTGNANVVVDSKGDITVVGAITPPKEVLLFDEKSFRKELPKFEARAAYGLPVIGNIFVFAGINFSLWSKIGPGKLYNIRIDGTYSTDPKVRQNYSIQASLNISAAAGATLRGEGGVGLEILGHDIKAGVGVNGTVGLKGYVDATPVIGYREEGEGDQDKKGVYFIRGDMELAAMPFLSLSGDIFIQLDSPWISPLPDKTWRWKLGDKEWPLGGSLGIKASVEHVFGSNEAPSIDFKKVDFSADKFMTDLMEEKAAPSGQAAAEKAGEWKEMNTQDSLPPSAAPAKSGAIEGEVAPPPPAQLPQQPSLEKESRRPPPTDFVSHGETGEQQKAGQKTFEKERAALEEALKMKGPQSSEEKGHQQQIEMAIEKSTLKEKDERWNRGVTAINQALAYAMNTGIAYDELSTILKKIKARKEYGFKELYAEDQETKFGVYASMSPSDIVVEIPKNPILTEIGGKRARSWSTETLVGTSRRQFKAAAARIIRAGGPNHPLAKLLDESGKFQNTTAAGIDELRWLEDPTLVEAGHVLSMKSEEPEMLILMSAYKNRLLSATIEHPGKGGHFALPREALDIGGIGVDPELAEDLTKYPTEDEPLLSREVVEKAKRIRF